MLPHHEEIIIGGEKDRDTPSFPKAAEERKTKGMRQRSRPELNGGNTTEDRNVIRMRKKR